MASRQAWAGQGRALRATSVLAPFHAPVHTELVRAASCVAKGCIKGGAVRLKLQPSLCSPLRKRKRAEPFIAVVALCGGLELAAAMR